MWASAPTGDTFLFLRFLRQLDLPVFSLEGFDFAADQVEDFAVDGPAFVGRQVFQFTAIPSRMRTDGPAATSEPSPPGPRSGRTTTSFRLIAENTRSALPGYDPALCCPKNSTAGANRPGRRRTSWRPEKSTPTPSLPGWRIPDRCALCPRKAKTAEPRSNGAPPSAVLFDYAMQFLITTGNLYAYCLFSVSSSLSFSLL